MGVLGHDLRNPLGAIAMSAQLLRRRADLPDGARALAATNARAASRMEEMINTLLDFARARFGAPIPLSRAPNDLGEIVLETVEELRSAWPHRDVEVVFHGDARVSGTRRGSRR